MKIIQLTRGLVTMVDDEDFDRLSEHKWYAHCVRSGFYDHRQSGRQGTKPFTVPMHREIMNAPKGLYVDHIDFDGLNNQKINLRLATCIENQRHQRLMKTNTSGFKGVKWNKGKWQASISIRNQEIYLGRFSDPEEAAHCYDAAVMEHFGEFAVTNASLCLYKTKGITA